MKKIFLSCCAIMLSLAASAQNTWQYEFSTLESNEVYKDKYAPVKAPVAISQNGIIYQTGRYDEPCMIGDSFLDNIATSAFVAALDAKGNHLWATGLRGAARITAATTDQEDNLYITGLFADDVVLGSSDYAEQTIVGCPDTHEMASAFIAKYDNNGILKAVKTISIEKNENEALANVGDAYTFDGSFTPNALAICEDRVYVSAKYAGTYKIDEISQNSSFYNAVGVLYDATALCVLSFEKETLSDTKQELDMNNTDKKEILESGPQSITIATDGKDVYVAMVCTSQVTLTMGDKQEELNPGTDAFSSIFVRLKNSDIQVIGTEKSDRIIRENDVNAMSIIDGKIYMAGTYSSPLSFAKNEHPDLWCDQWISCFDADSYEQQWCYSTDAKKDNMPNNDAKYRYTTMATYTPNGEWKSIGTTNLTLDLNKRFTVDDTQTHLGIASTGNLVATTDPTDTGCKLTVQETGGNSLPKLNAGQGNVEALFYDLQGRVTNPNTKKGIYIHNGKKTVR